MTATKDDGSIEATPQLVTVETLRALIRHGGFDRLPGAVVPELEPHAEALSIAAGFAGCTTPQRLAMLLGQSLWECAGLTALVELDGPQCDRYDGGRRYRGRGYLHLTGLPNYRHVGAQLGEDLVATPDKAAEQKLLGPILAIYWADAGINRLVDLDDDFGVTRAINGPAATIESSYHGRRMRLRDHALRLISPA